MIERRDRLLAVVAALAAAALWGGWFPVTRLGITSGDVSAMDMILLRCSVGAIVLGPLALRRGLKSGKAGWGGTLAIWATMSGPFAFAMGMGVVHAPAAHAAIFVPGVYPALVFLVSLFVFKDPATLRRWLGLVAVIAGVAIIAAATLAEDQGGLGGELAGYLWFQVCAWSWVVYTVIVRASGLSAAHALGILHVGALLVWGPVWLIVGDSGLVDLPIDALAFQIGYHGLLNGLVAIFLYNVAVTRLGAAEAAAFAAFVPTFAALAAWPILGEAIGPAELAALACVTIGVVLISGARARTAD